MVDSSSGAIVDELDLTEAAGTSLASEAVSPLHPTKNRRVLNSPEIKLSEFRRTRDSGLVIRLFPTPHVFGTSQLKQPEHANAPQGDPEKALEAFELRSLEAEALSLSRMLKSLQPFETFPGFPTSALQVDSFPTSSQDQHAEEVILEIGIGGNGGADELLGLRSDGRLVVAVKDRNDSFSSCGFTNSNLATPKVAKSKRRTYGLSYSSRGSTPSSSIGSASELQFPTVDLRSPPSPEPLGALCPGSPLRWRSRNSSVSPLEETHVPNKSQETQVQGLPVGRNLSFSEYVAGNMSGKVLFKDAKKKADDSELVPVEPGLSGVVRKLKATYVDVEEEELLSTMTPPGISLLDGNGKDYSIALEYQGPPPGHCVPKMEPLDVRAIRSSNVPVLKPAALPEKTRGTTSFLPQSSASFVNSFPAWFNSDLRSRDRTKRGGSSASVSWEGVVDPGTSSIPVSPLSSTLSRVAVDCPDLGMATPDKPRITFAPDQMGMAVSLTTSRVAGAWTFTQASEGEFEVASKSDLVSDSRPLVSRSFRSCASDSILAKSEPVGLWKLQSSVDYSGTDPLRQTGHRPRSMSLPGVQAIVSTGPEGADSFLTPSSCNNSPVPNLQQRRKGECYLCHKGHRLTDKESCLVCNAKYCYSCVLTAMESMPEGRKCRTCIGKPVDEAKRPYIGKPSRLLNRLLRLQEVQQIMKAEKECAANQLRPEQLYVNGRQLNQEELALLLKCPNPPQKLKPGRYWYDLQSGLWGKEGERPDKFISPDMKVGGPLQENASNGTTQVFMNGRELGKLELKMLKLAGVHCPPSTHLWVEPDGSYQEEGQNNSKGNIWNKTSVRLLYPFFSLPTPGASTRFTQRAAPDTYTPGYTLQNKLHKILVLGLEGSGRSTLFKQTKFLFKDGFSQEERMQMKTVIQRHINRYIGILLEGRERLEEEEDDMEDNNIGYATGDYSDETMCIKRNVYALDVRLKQQAEWFLEMLAEGSLDISVVTSSSEYPLLVDELWRDPAIQATHKRKDELSYLPDAAEYFLEKVVEISSIEYIPSDEDILQAEGLAQGSGLAEIEFCLDDKVPSYQDPDVTSPSRYQLIKVGGKGMADGCKWLDMFEDVHAVVFCVAISDYDQVLVDSNGISCSKLRQKELFESVLKHPILGEKPMVLLLNKYDLFEGKICKGIPLTTCEWFSDFRPVGASQMTAQMQAQQGYTYVVHKYKELFACSGHKVFTFKLNATERDKVLEAFQYVREILKWKDNGWDLFPEESSYSTDFSSYSQRHYFPTSERDGFITDRNKNTVEF